MATKLAAGWAALYGLVALVWTVTGTGFPYGPGSQAGDTSPLRALDPAIGAPLFWAALLLAAAALFFLDGPLRVYGTARRVLLAYVWVVVAALLVVLPDIELRAVAGYLPMLIIGYPFGWPPVDYSEIFTWTLANQAFAVLGGVLLARAVWPSFTGRWTTRESAARWGRWATWLAAAIPVFYAAIRLAWAAGIPLGIPAAFLEDMQRTGLVWAGAGLGGFALVGAILTLGLTQRWGEVFPRWMVGLAGKRVPIKLATVPATVVAILVMSASVGFFAQTGAFAEIAEHGLSTAPILTWPAWSLALGAATLGYHLRRRPPRDTTPGVVAVPVRAAPGQL